MPCEGEPNMHCKCFECSFWNRGVTGYQILGGQSVMRIMWRAAAGRWRLLFCQKLGGQLPTLLTHQWDAWLKSISNHCGRTPRGARGVKRSEILLEIQKNSLPGRPSNQNWAKWKNICPFLMNFDAFLNVFLVLVNFGRMVDLAMSIFEFLTKFLIFWHPWHPTEVRRAPLIHLKKKKIQKGFQYIKISQRTQILCMNHYKR